MKKIKGIVLAALSLALIVGIFAVAKPAQVQPKFQRHYVITGT